MSLHHHQSTILVVDDQESNIQTVGALLQKAGYNVMPAMTVGEALQRMNARPPDLILLDLMMPGPGGLDLCRRLKSKLPWQEIPVIFLSAVTEVNLITEALEAGAVDYVTKPFHSAELLSRVRTHLALKAGHDDLRRLAADKEELLSLMAHDIQNRLAAIQLHAAYLVQTRSDPNPEERRCLAAIVSESATLTATIRELLANQYAAGQPLHLMPVDLMAVCRSSARLLKYLADQKGQSISLTGPSSATVTADRGAIHHVIENLLSNAVKFSPPGSAILMQVTTGQQGTTLTVHDHGPGFSEEDRKHMFTRYGRLSARPTAGEPSTGLGLSIVHTLTGKMGGHIGLVSPPGQSAIMALTFPASITHLP